MANTINEAIQELHSSLRDYIEATYHISDPALVAQRRELLNKLGTIYQRPYLESTPKYVAGDKFETIPAIPDSALKLFEALSKEGGKSTMLLYDPPYKHQFQSISECLVKGRNLVIMTGTGSGKTESFLLPIIGKMAREASQKPKAFREERAVRAMVLYPMNALVNDQLGRLRSILTDDRLKGHFLDWSGRIPTFARYTSRTPYPGVRTGKKDQIRLKSFENFYVEIERTALDSKNPKQAQAQQLKSQLEKKGKWPGKPNLTKWYGSKGERWDDPKTGDFKRAITLPEDSELITRYEIQDLPPDLLITNYSMLEYMLMRPIERPIFDLTRKWLERNPEEKFTIVLDEAHLYRGGAGAEVGLLLRRLRDRLEIDKGRFQVICATASFNDKEYASTFAAQLAGVDPSSFATIVGEYDLRSGSPGTTDDAEAIVRLDMDDFYRAESDERRIELLAPFLVHRQINPQAGRPLSRLLYDSLVGFGPMLTLIGTTMKSATPIADLGRILFPNVEGKLADMAVTSLLYLGGLAKENPNSAGLLPCRVHNFFRGLPGLWICPDPNCTAISLEHRNGLNGKLFGQPRDHCDCGARVFEFYTCRHCGSPYMRGYSDNVRDPSSLWSDPGLRIRLMTSEVYDLYPIDILLKEPENPSNVEEAYLDLVTGRLNPEQLGPRSRKVYLRRNKINQSDGKDGNQLDQGTLGQFIPCGICEQRAGYGASSVQDHQTKGDQPFLALLARQIQIQPPSIIQNPNLPEKFAPLKGRKVLVFSDSRQVAARLAPNLQMYSSRDVIRPLLVWGMTRLQNNKFIEPQLSLDDSYFALVLASNYFKVRLRPELKPSENFSTVDEGIAEAIKNNVLDDELKLFHLFSSLRTEQTPESLLASIFNTISDRYFGFEALALASICERSNLRERIERLPDIPGFADTLVSKLSLVRFWIKCWKDAHRYWLRDMNESWWQSPKGVSGHKTGRFNAFTNHLDSKALTSRFNKEWATELLKIFAQDVNGTYRLVGKNLSFDFGKGWVRCNHCTSIHRPTLSFAKCQECGSASLSPLNPEDDVFQARKGYYRKQSAVILSDKPNPPYSLIAAEHTAQLNAPQGEQVFSQAEMNELLFQDINISWPLEAEQAFAIDILSSTTTMEVGIDIGALSGVALRNMPPGRANYQQRSGRAGRRGNSVATVVAYGSVDSHDEHYFSSPDEMISGPVVDPLLTLNSADIARRHIRAFLLQRYHQHKLPMIPPLEQPDLFSVLGKVAGFKTKTAILNRNDFEKWLRDNESALQQRVTKWIPNELSEPDASSLVKEMISDCLSAIDQALEIDTHDGEVISEDEEDVNELSVKRGDSNNLLDHLLYCGVLPRYAFPTEVATFHIFDVNRSSSFRPVMKYAPSQALPIALSQYAPGKQVWVANKCYTSGAIYSPIPDERLTAWKNKRVYFECTECGFGKTEHFSERMNKEPRDCEACLSELTFKPKQWLRPPGFAHPISSPEETSPENVPETSYATRAKLQIPFREDEKWVKINDSIWALPNRPHLLVTNSGPAEKGYDYCTSCGRIESTHNSSNQLFNPHAKPFPDREPMCNAGFTTRGIVLGTDFITDICLFSLKIKEPRRLKPGYYSTNVVLRTICEALSKAASKILEIEPSDVLAEFRPALTPAGQKGQEVEIFLYDTLPGGAGLSSQLPRHARKLFETALDILMNCAEGCNSSCYRCLRTFRNKFDHSLLDRYVGAELIQLLLNGIEPTPNQDLISTNLQYLFEDLARNAPSGFKCELNKGVAIPDIGEIMAPILISTGTKKYIITLSGALAPDVSLNFPTVNSLPANIMVLKPIDELLVKLNLPSATKFVYSSISEMK